jgi:hypothetical protein
LHFVRAADAVLGQLVGAVKRGGQVLLVEYDRRAASRHLYAAAATKK